jgi:hypothetical protein
MLGMSLLSRSPADAAGTRSCPVCHDRVVSGDPVIDVRGMRFHTRCARYGTRARGVPARAR